MRIEKSDWVKSPGHHIELTKGPLMAYIDTADGWLIAFGIKFFGVAWSWSLGTDM